jgi:hypothetical protein
MAGMTIQQAREKWGNIPGKPAGWPSRAVIRKWIDEGRIKVKRLGDIENVGPKLAKTIIIMQENPPEPKTAPITRPKGTGARKPLAPEAPAAPAAVSGWNIPARTRKNRWPF